MIQQSSLHVMQLNIDLSLGVFQNSSSGTHGLNLLITRKESMQAIVLCLFLTFIPFLDIPVFWPILVMYFFVS